MVGRSTISCGTQLLGYGNGLLPGDDVDLSQYLDVNILTGAVKLFLRELPIPLITFDAYTDIMKATALVSDAEDSNTDWKGLICSLKLLPKSHYTTLNHLADHLYKYVHTYIVYSNVRCRNLLKGARVSRQ